MGSVEGLWNTHKKSFGVTLLLKIYAYSALALLLRSVCVARCNPGHSFASLMTWTYGFISPGDDIINWFKISRYSINSG